MSIRSCRRTAIGSVLLLAAAGCGKSSSLGFSIAGTAEPASATTITVDRLTLEIPIGAVAVATPIQIVRSPLHASNAQRIAPGFSIQPTGLAFAVAAEVSISFVGLALPDGVTEADLFLGLLGPTGLVTPLPGSTVDIAGRFVHAPLNVLATVVLAAPVAAPPANGAGKLVFLRAGAEGTPDLWSAEPDGSGIALVTAHSLGEFLSSPRVAPAASRVAFTETVGGAAEPRAWIVALNGAGRTLVTIDGSREEVGDLNAAGTRLYVSRRASGAAYADLAVYDLTTAPPFARTSITTTPDDDEHEPRVSPDGTQLLYLDREGRLVSLSVLPGATPKLVTKTAVIAFAWRPDGQRAVVERPITLGGGLAEVKPGASSSLPFAIHATAGAHRPTYSPNGEHLLFELFETDPAFRKNTLRQISRKGAFASILLGGSATVFPGEAPYARP